jgi:hypothetical protein
MFTYAIIPGLHRPTSPPCPHDGTKEELFWHPVKKAYFEIFFCTAQAILQRMMMEARDGVVRL